MDLDNGDEFLKGDDMGDARPKIRLSYLILSSFHVDQEQFIFNLTNGYKINL